MSIASIRGKAGHDVMDTCCIMSWALPMKKLNHLNRNVILTKFSSLAAVEGVILTPSGAASEENFVKMVSFLLQWSKLSPWCCLFLANSNNWYSILRWQAPLTWLLQFNISCVMFDGPQGKSSSQKGFNSSFPELLSRDSFQHVVKNAMPEPMSIKNSDVSMHQNV